MTGSSGQPGSDNSAPAAANALAAAQWNSNQQTFNAEVERLAEYSASIYAKTAEEKTYYLDYYRNYYRNGGKTENATAPKQAANDTMVTVNGVEYKRYRELQKLLLRSKFLYSVGKALKGSLRI